MKGVETPFMTIQLAKATKKKKKGKTKPNMINSTIPCDVKSIKLQFITTGHGKKKKTGETPTTQEHTISYRLRPNTNTS
jgi:hypothetical protein